MSRLPLVRRQIAAARHQSTLFVLCVALSLVTLVSLGGFSRSVHSSFLKDARKLHAGDIIIRSHYPFSPLLTKELASLKDRNVIESAKVYEFYSVVRAARGEASLLANIKAVEAGYPYYGSVELASGRRFQEVLAEGGIVVEQSLLDRLGLRIGDRLAVGSASFAVLDVVVHEPDRPVTFFSLGPRVFLSARQLDRLDLTGKGSRVNYRILAKVRDGKDIDGTAAAIASAADRDRERVETFRTAGSRVKRFFDNFLFFLNLIGIFTLLLAGIGIQSALAAFLREQERTVAIMKAVGAGSSFILGSYLAVVSVLGLAGTVAGLVLSFLLQRLLPGLFQGLLPDNLDLVVSPVAVAEGILLGLAVVVLFTALPMLRLKEVRPRTIFGKEDRPGQGRSVSILIAVVGLFFLVLVLWRVREMKTGIYFTGGVVLLILAALTVSAGLLRVLKERRIRNLVLRQAFKGLFRPGNATFPVMVTLTAALALIFAVTLVQKNLDATFVRSFPPDSPNLFFLDIQLHQKEDFGQALGTEAVFYPVVRGTIQSINSQAIDRQRERQKRGDNLGREFNLTYRESLLNDERILRGKELFRKDWTGPQVSVLDTVLEMRDLEIGDRITFRVQGLPVEARVSSIRTRTSASLQPFFYFVFQEEVLRDAPQTLFTALRLDKERIAPLQNRIAVRFPNVSAVDVTETASAFGKIMVRLSLIVNFFTLFSVAAGLLIIVSSVFATRHARMREAVFFTILGSRSRFIRAVFALESLVIGASSSLAGLVLAQTAAWGICRLVLDVGYSPFIGVSCLMAGGTSFVVMAVGLGAAAPILRKKPAVFLREQAEE